MDVVTGTGTYAVALAEAGYQVTGIDLSQAMITEAKQKASSQHMKLKILL